jgi:hypothetical protein
LSPELGRNLFFKIYFIFRSIAKFGAFLLWMIARSEKRRKRQDQKKISGTATKLERSKQRSNGAGEWHASGSSSRGDDGGRSGDGISEWTWPGKALELGSNLGQTSGTGSQPRAQHAVPEGA